MKKSETLTVNYYIFYTLVSLGEAGMGGCGVPMIKFGVGVALGGVAVGEGDWCAW